MALHQLDTENADRDISSLITVLTDTVAVAGICQGLIKLGDGAKDLDGTGGDFSLVITVGGQTVQPSPQTITFSTAVRGMVWTTPFPVVAGDEVIMRILSPNAADTDIDVTAYLYDTTYSLPDAVAGAAGGLFIAGTNASLTVTGTTTLTGNVSCGAGFDVVGAWSAGSVLVDGTTTLTGNVSCGAGFDVVGAMSANSLLIDTTTTLTGNVSFGGTFDVVGALTAGSVSIDAGFDVVGALSANSLLIDTTTTLTGAVATGAVTFASVSITGQLDMANLLVDSTVAIGTTFTISGTTTLTGAVSLGSTLDIVGASTFASMSITGQLDAGNLLVDTTTALTGAVTAPAGIAADITGNITGNLSGTVGSVTGAVGSVAGNVDGNVDGTVAGVTPATSANVNTEVSDVMKTDTIAEMAQGIPPTTPTFEEAIMYGYMALTKLIDIDSTTKEFYNNAGTVIWKKALADDGTNYTEAKGASGP